MNGPIEKDAPGARRSCTRPLVAIDAAASLREAARPMRAEHVGALVVTTGLEDRRAAMGPVSDRDIADAVAAAQITLLDKEIAS